MFCTYNYVCITKAGVIQQHGLVFTCCSGSDLSPSRCILPRSKTVLAKDSIQVPVPPASISNVAHSEGSQCRFQDDCDDAAGVNTVTNDVPATELIFPPDVIQSVRLLKCVPQASRHFAGTKLARILEDVSEKNDLGSWSCLFKVQPLLSSCVTAW